MKFNLLLILLGTLVLSQSFAQENYNIGKLYKHAYSPFRINRDKIIIKKDFLIKERAKSFQDKIYDRAFDPGCRIQHSFKLSNINLRAGDKYRVIGVFINDHTGQLIITARNFFKIPRDLTFECSKTVFHSRDSLDVVERAFGYEIEFEIHK